MMEPLCLKPATPPKPSSCFPSELEMLYPRVDVSVMEDVSSWLMTFVLIVTWALRRLFQQGPGQGTPCEPREKG